MDDSPFIKKIREINTIMEMDATDTTYKYALIRGVAEICQRYNQFKQEEGGRIYLPTGLLVEKWLLYYYPIIASPVFIPQKGNEKPLEYKRNNLAFRKYFTKITQYYSSKGGFSVFYNDFRRETIPIEIREDFRVLVRSIVSTIKQYPMRHLGYSLNHREYSIMKPENGKPLKIEISQKYLIEACGKFSLDPELYEVFRLFGGYFSGKQSIISKWVEFTVRADRKKPLNPEAAYKVLSEVPSTEREVSEARRFYESLLRSEGYLECVWSGRRITNNIELAIDHVIPFSIWRNNDLWNLLPTHQIINSKKKNQIPSEALLLRRSEAIHHYWRLLEEKYPERFNTETLISLTGTTNETAFQRVIENNRFLVKNQGYPEWDTL